MTNKPVFGLFATFGLCLILSSCFRETGVEDFPVTATIVTDENTDNISIGTVASGKVVDYVLQNSVLQVIINGSINNPNRNIFLPKASGAILDISTQFQERQTRKTVSRDDDGMNLVTQGVNMSSDSLISYDDIQIRQDSETRASITLTGSLYDLDGSLEAAGAIVDSGTRRVADCEVTTIYQLQEIVDASVIQTDEEFLSITTVVANTGERPLPIFTIHDIAVTTIGANSIFVPYPDWGFEVPSGDGPAYPEFIHFQPTLVNTAHYAWTSRMEGILMVTREQEPTRHAEHTLVGKLGTPGAMLEPGGQLTFIREVLGFNSGTQFINGITAITAYRGIITFLTQSLRPGSPFQVRGGMSVDPATANLPGGRFTLEYTDNIRYFNGSDFVDLEEGRRFPIFGDQFISEFYSFLGDESDQTEFLLPTGQLAISAQALNSSPRLITARVDVTTNEDGEEETTAVPIVIPEADVFLMGAIPVADSHSEVTFLIQTEALRTLMGRVTVDRVSGEGPVELGSFPTNRQGPFLYVNTITELQAGLPNGEYELLVSHGPLHELEILPHTIAVTSDPNDEDVGATQDFVVEMDPEVSHDNYLSADFDVRSSKDPLGLVEQTQLMRLAYAEDLDVLFLADTESQSIFEIEFDALAGSLGGFDVEDQTGDVDSFIDELAVTRALATIGKVAGPFPDRGRFALLNLPSEEEREKLLTPYFETDAGGFYDRARQLGEGVVVHVTRPRAPKGLETGLFTSVAERLGLPEGTPVPGDNPVYGETAGSGSGTRLIDFDLVQILSGNRYDEYLLARQDWFNLLDAGIFKPATGGSMPGPTKTLPIGTVRTFVSVGNTELRENDLADFWSSILAGNAFVTNGPLLEVRAGNANPGGTANIAGDTVSVHIKLSAASWIPVDQVRAVVDGQTQVLDLALDPEEIVRFEGDVTLTLPPGRNNHWIVIEAGASLDALAGAPAETGNYGRVYPGHLPLAFTNPIFVNN